MAFPPEPSRSAAKGALLEHKLAARVDGPVVSLPWSAETLGQLDEALVQGQVVSDGVFPSLVRSPEEREAGLQELVDFTQSEPFARRALNRHHDQGDVGVGGLLGAPQTGVSLLPFSGCVVRALHHRLCAQQCCVQGTGSRIGGQWTVQMLLGALGRHGCASFSFFAAQRC